jgi:predicted enzyme related to lactoylglutathione lyase
VSAGSLREVQITIDCADPDQQAEFWAAALGYVRRGTLGPYRSIVDPDGAHPVVVLQQVAEPKVGKARIHLDLYVDDIPAEVERLTALGARPLEGGWFEEAGERWHVMVDPEGNEFCLCSR